MNTTEKKLAHLVRQHPNLYNHARQDYKDNLRGHLSLKEIAGNMGKTEDEVKLIWKNLRDKFCKAKRRMGSRRRDSLLERPGPVLLVQLSWLNPFIKPKGTVLGETHEVCLKKHYIIHLKLTKITFLITYCMQTWNNNRSNI